MQGLGLNQNGEPETLTDVITVTADGTQTTVTITINGTNDLPEIGGTATGSVTEDDPINTVSGQLSITDQDVGEAVFIAQSNASTPYGTFSILADGAWTYTIDNGNDTVQALRLG